MRKTILYLSGFMIISSLSVSCVSKKKFEELARAKREVDRNLLDLKRDKKQLEDQLQLAKDDFNTIRYKLTENNAVKDKTIDQLYTKLRSLESKQVELKSELSNVADQIKTTTQSTSEQISSLESSLQKVSNERDQLRRQLTEVQTNLEFENQKIKAQLESATNNLQAQNGEVEKLKDMDLKNKTVALFGCGDSVSFSSSFCDALGVIYHELQHTGCTFTGEVDLSEYRFDGSGGVIDGKFVGLPIDDNNESDRTDTRIKKWTDSLKVTVLS